MKKILSLLLTLVFCFALASCNLFAKDYEVETKDITLDGVKLGLPELYKEEELTDELRLLGVDYFFGGYSSALMIYKEGFKDYAPDIDMTSWTARDYASVYISNNSELCKDSTVVMEGELATFRYDAEVEGDLYSYYAIIVRGKSEIWNYMFMSRAEDFDIHKPYFIEWVNSAEYL